jgi:hypothetical protein
MAKMWVVEEVPLGDGKMGQRQTVGETGEMPNGNWYYVKPNERMNKDQQAEWDRVMGLLAKIKGEDLRGVICFAGLLDHCLKNGSAYEDPSDKKKK